MGAEGTRCWQAVVCVRLKCLTSQELPTLHRKKATNKGQREQNEALEYGEIREELEALDTRDILHP